MKKFTFSNILNDNRALRIFAVVVAVLCWISVQMTQSIVKNQTIHNVTVNIDWESQNLTQLGLSIIEGSEAVVSVTVRGPTTTVGQLKPENLKVAANITDISKPGWSEVSLTLVNEGQGELENVEIVSFSPSTVRVRFDRLVQRTIAIEPVVKGLSTLPAYVSDPEMVTPATVTVTGPQADLNKIERAVVEVELLEPLSRSYVNDTLPIKLLNAQGDELALSALHLTLDNETAQILIRVLRIKTLPLIVGFTNIPQGAFPISELEMLMEMTSYELQVAGPVDAMESYQEVILGYISIKELTITENEYIFDVELPSNQYVNMDNITSVAVEFDTENWSTARFNVGSQQMRIINDPPGYDVSVLTSSLSNLVLIGKKSVLETVTADDIVVTVDLSEKTLAIGQYTYPVKISLPTKGLVWAVGDYSVIIQVVE